MNISNMHVNFHLCCIRKFDETEEDRTSKLSTIAGLPSGPASISPVEFDYDMTLKSIFTSKFISVLLYFYVCRTSMFTLLLILKCSEGASKHRAPSLSQQKS